MLDKKLLYYFSLLGQIGFIIIGSILVCVWFYKLIEKITGQNTLLFILFVFLGIISGFFSVYRMIKKGENK